MSEEKEWFCVRPAEDEADGPLLLSEIRDWLRRGVIHADCMVWRQGMVDWLPAGSVPELAASPPRPEPTPEPAPAPEPAPSEPAPSSEPVPSPDSEPSPKPATHVPVATIDSRDAAYDWQIVSFAMQIGGIWVAASVVCMAAGAGLANLMENPWLAFLGPFLVGLLTVIALQCLTGGIARLTTRMIEGRAYTSKDAWSFVNRRWAGLIFGNVCFLLGLAILAGLVSYLVTSLTKIPAVGEILGALLIVPTFFFFLVSGAALLNSYLLPCIMGVEDTGFLGAVQHLVKFSNKPTRMIQVLDEFYTTMFSVVPLLLASGAVALGALYLALRTCTSETFRRVFEQEGSNALANLLQFGSVGAIVYAWVAFLVAYLITTFTIIYYNGSR